MVIKRFVVLLFFICVAATAKPVLNIQHWQTDNGSRVYFVRATELPMVDIQLAFRAGSAYDGKQYGIAQLTNNMLDQGTKNFSSDKIAQKFADVGAVFNHETSRDMALVGFRSLTKPGYLPSALEIYINVLTEPTFPSKAFQRVKNITLLSIQQEGQFPFTVAKKSFYKQIYGEQPYGHPTIGTQQMVTNLTRKNLQAFYRQYYVAKNAVLAIVGDITEKQARNIANEITEKLPAGEMAKKLSLAQNITKQIQDHISFPAEQTSIIFGQVGIKRNNPDRFALYVGNYILGGGMTSQLFKNVRENRGLAYSINSRFLLLNYRGPFAISLQTRNNEAKQALIVAEETLAQFIQNGPTKQAIKNAKQYIIGAFPLGIASNSAILANLINIGFYNLPLNYLDTYRDKIRTITRQEIKAAFKKYVHPNKMAIITVGGNTHMR